MIQPTPGGWFLTDDFFAPKKYRIPNGTTLNAGILAVTEVFDGLLPPALAEQSLA